MSDKNASKPEGSPSPIGEISNEPSALEVFLDANQKKLILLGVIAILGLIGYVIFDGLRKKGAREDAAIVAAARTVAELEAAANSLEGSNAGGSALILKSQQQWNDQQQSEAITTLESFVSKYPQHPALGNAYATLGSYFLKTSNKEKAKAALQNAADQKTSASSLALIDLGDIALSEGNNEAAKEFYNLVISNFESHLQVKGLAQQRLKLVGVDAPVEKTAAPEPAAQPEAATLGDLPKLEVPSKRTAPVPPQTEKPAETSPAE